MAKRKPAPQPYAKSDQIQIRGNQIFSLLRQKWIPLTPEEMVRQQYLQVLVEEYGFTHEQIAKSKGIPFILTFHKRKPDDKPPWDRESSPGNKVHFDLIPYRYIAYDSEFELRDKLKQELDAFFSQAL